MSRRKKVPGHRIHREHREKIFIGYSLCGLRDLCGGVLASILSLLLLLSACTPAPTATPTVLEGWALVETPEYSLLLPISWKVHPVTAENASDELAALRKVNPFLAQSIGSSKAMQDLSLWAVDEGEAGSGAATAGLRENMNISRIPLEGEKLEDLQPVLDALKEEYTQGGAQINESELYTVNNQPALRVAYKLDRSVAGQTVSMVGHQYFFVTGDTLWTLSYTAGPERHESLATVADLSARSFHVTP